MLIAALCGGILKFDHDKSAQSPYSQFLMMMSLGTCLLVILWDLNFGDAIGLSMIFFASMIVGVGIISSAIIIAHHGSSLSLTAATTIWISAGIGMSVGYSLYFTAFVATFIGYFFLRLLDKMTDRR